MQFAAVSSIAPCLQITRITRLMKVIASHNGLAAAERAYERLKAGAPPLDAVVEGVGLIEDDPEETTVGYGGIPNEEGVVELDAAVMDGKTHRGAGVAALQGVRHPSQVARLLMEQTNRVLLVGEGALKFAQGQRFCGREPADRARPASLAPLEADPVADRRLAGPAAGNRGPQGAKVVRRPFPRPSRARQSRARSTSRPSAPAATSPAAPAPAATLSNCRGAWEIRRSSGPASTSTTTLGSCGSIGHGEANLENVTSFAAVELLRGGLSPEQAGLELLRRIAAKTRPEQLDEQGRPKFNLWLYLLAKDGRSRRRDHARSEAICDCR